MGKRKDTHSEPEAEETDIVNVDFDFFDIVGDDFLSIKSLIRQLLGLDNVLFNLSALTQLVMDAKVGTTIKADDEEYNDVLAVLAVAEFDPNKGETAKLLDYWLEVVDTPETLRALHKLKAANKKAGLMISERFLNMPYEVVPPLYTVLSQEIAARKLEYDFLIVPSRVYVQKESKLDGETPKNAKRGAGAAKTEIHLFHEEDRVLNRTSLASSHFEFKTPVEETDSRRAFHNYGIYSLGNLAILDAAKLPEVAEAVGNIAKLMED